MSRVSHRLNVVVHSIRFKLALTEDRPTIKPYEEAAWAELADADVIGAQEKRRQPIADALHR